MKRTGIIPCIIALFCLTLLSGIGAVQAENGKKEFKLVASNDCGNPEAQSFLVKGEDYHLPKNYQGDPKALTCNFGTKVIYAFDKVDINADMRMEVVYLVDGDRTLIVSADGNAIQEKVELKDGKTARFVVDLPRKAYAYGQLVLVFEALKGPNAIVSELNIYSTNPRPLIPMDKEKKTALSNMQAYTVDTTVNAESVLPQFTPVPSQVAGIYQPAISLNGIWQFNEKPDAGFYRNFSSNDQWKSIVVPGQWSMQGFKVDSASFGGYRTTFSVPEEWLSQTVKLRFDGVSSESVVYLNGQEIGQHMGGMTAFELDITKALKKGENQLALQVRSESLADMLGSLTQYAAHQLGGITRKVTLFTVPKTYISDIRIVTDLDAQYKNANLKVRVQVKNNSSEIAANEMIRISVPGLPTVIEKELPALQPGATWNGWLEQQVTAPLKWDNEHPNLYTLHAELRNNNKITEQVDKRFGFREIEIAGNRFLVNGIPVKLRGVNRHEAHPLGGRVLTTELRREDAELYRAANCNYIRTSHYPPGEEFVEICNELGLFVELEAPVCWLGHHANENWQQLSYRDPQYYPYVLQANMETIHFYRNHPSIIFWSIANESYWNKEFAQVLEYVKKADPTRPSAFHDQAYGGFNNQGSTTPVANIHYPGPSGYKTAAKSDRPMVYGEYCHLNVYNRSELVTDPGVRSDWALALAPTWENMYKTDGVLGGAIWSGIDDIFQMPDGSAVGYGPWGPIDGWRRPKPEYWDMKKIYSPIRVYTKTLQPANEFTLDVENRHSFTNLNELQINWTYGNEQGITKLDLKPGEQGKLKITVKHPDDANALYLSFKDPRGFITDEYLIPVGEQHQNKLPASQILPTRLKTKADRYVITGKDFVCEISRANGQIITLKKNKQEILNGGPLLMALPLTGGGCYPNHNANTPVFNDLCSDWQTSQVSAQQEGENVTVKVSGKYKEFEGHYTLQINAGGEVVTDYHFTALQDVNPRQWGMVFEAPKSLNTLFWRRSGTWSVYPDDHISRPVGEAELFYQGVPLDADPRTAPSWSWSKDCNELGSNDFRSTRRNILYAGLKDKQGTTLTTVSDGQQHWRSWLEKDKICLLVADFVTAGDEMFLSGYYAPYRKPLKKGDEITGKIVLRGEFQ